MDWTVDWTMDCNLDGILDEYDWQNALQTTAVFLCRGLNCFWGRKHYSCMQSHHLFEYLMVCVSWSL